MKKTLTAALAACMLMSLVQFSASAKQKAPAKTQEQIELKIDSPAMKENFQNGTEQKSAKSEQQEAIKPVTAAQTSTTDKNVPKTEKSKAKKDKTKEKQKMLLKKKNRLNP